jgi:hypothetical protein
MIARGVIADDWNVHALPVDTGRVVAFRSKMGTQLIAE